MSIDQDTTVFQSHKLLLDGQQRMTSLAAVLKGKPITVRGRKRPIDILFNLEHPEGAPIEITEVISDEDSPFHDEHDEDQNGHFDADQIDDINDSDEREIKTLQERLEMRTFVVFSKVLAQQPNWVSVTQVFRTSDTEVLKKAGVTSIDDPRYEKYSKRLQQLRGIEDYLYVMHVLERDMSYEEVAEIFVRVNSLGVKLRASDLAFAQISARWNNVLRLLEEFADECEDQHVHLDHGLLVRTMVVFASKQCKFQVVGGLPLKRLKAGWEEAKEGLRFAINFLRANAGIENESLLSSPLFLIPIAVLSRLRNNKLSNLETSQLHFWLLAGSERGHYSRGSSETLLNEDLNILFRGGKTDMLITSLKRQFGRLSVDPSDFAGRGTRSPLFSLAYLALKAAGAMDWHSGLELSLAHHGKAHLIQYHHIFPKSLLKKAGYEKGVTNEIANMAFISGQTNRRISNKKPSDYIPKIIEQRSEDALQRQMIPTDPELHKIENYLKFLEARREMLANAINLYMENVSEGRPLGTNLG